MTVLRRLSLAVLWLVLAAPAAALPVSPSERAQAFAECAGGLSAMSNQITSLPEEDAAKFTRMRDLFDQMLEAVLPSAIDYGMPEFQAANWKFDAWIRSTSIINEASYSFDKGRAERAQAVIEADFQTCEAMILTAG